VDLGTLVAYEMSKGSIEIILPKYYTFINDTSRGCIYILSLQLTLDLLSQRNNLNQHLDHMNAHFDLL